MEELKKKILEDGYVINENDKRCGILWRDRVYRSLKILELYYNFK